MKGVELLLKLDCHRILDVKVSAFDFGDGHTLRVESENCLREIFADVAYKEVFMNKDLLLLLFLLDLAGFSLCFLLG